MDFFKTLYEIYHHCMENGVEVWGWDDPVTRTAGFGSGIEEWEITLQCHQAAAPSNDWEAEAWRLFRTPEGRDELARILSTPE